MLRLTLFRHAEADRPSDVADYDRPLSAGGRADAARMGERLLETELRPDLVMLSPSRRTLETWALASAAARLDAAPCRFEPSLYATDAEKVFILVRNLEAGLRDVMLVGHNPWMEELARLLANPSQRSGGSGLASGMGTAAMAVLDLPPDRWRDVAAGSGRLVHLLTPSS